MAAKSYEALCKIREHIARIDLLMHDVPESIETKDLSDAVRDLRTRTIKQVIATKRSLGMEITTVTIKPAEEISLEQVPTEEATETSLISKNGKTYHPDPKISKFIETYVQMGGLPLIKVFKPFSLKKPCIEMYEVLQFLKTIFDLRIKNNLFMDCGVYIHLCEYSTFYVGLAKTEFMGMKFATVHDAIVSRLNEHRNWPDSIVKANWTVLYKIISMISYIPGDKEDENLVTLLIEKCVGPNRVRGGDYTYIGHQIFPNISIEEIKEKLMQKSIL
jgi:hypothetical protein